jgi:proteasome lid subunit RPN8/RPN11
MRSQLLLSQTHLDEMLQHVEQHVPLEACGLLAGKSDQVQKVFLIRNQAQSPVRFVMDPYQQLGAFEWIDSQGLDLIGIFHSHPAGSETPSDTDIAEAAYDVVHMIWSRLNGKWKARGFCLDNGQAHEIPLLISDR